MGAVRLPGTPGRGNPVPVDRPVQAMDTVRPMASTFASVDDYIAAAAVDVRPILEDIRRTMHEAVPGAGEAIKYDMPTLTLDGRSVVHVAAWKHHIGLYPLPDGDPALTAELAPVRHRQGHGPLPPGSAGPDRADRAGHGGAGRTATRPTSPLDGPAEPGGTCRTERWSGAAPVGGHRQSRPAQLVSGP